MTRLQTAYAIGLLGRNVQLHHANLHMQAFNILFNACYSSDTRADETDQAGLDAAM